MASLCLSGGRGLTGLFLFFEKREHSGWKRKEKERKKGEHMLSFLHYNHIFYLQNYKPKSAFNLALTSLSPAPSIFP